MKWIWPILVLLAGFAAAALLILTGPDVQPQAPQAVAPLVRVVVADPKTRQMSVQTHGSVVPRTESELVPELDGAVVEMSPQLVAGGFFAKGDVLLRVDPLDYQVALEQARAGLARAESDLDNAEKNNKRQQDLVKRGAISDAERDDAENRQTIAQATLREAKARLSRARRDLARTNIVAPYDGRVRTERVDVGQFVRRGTAIATIYAVDYAEVRLPIPNADLAFLDLPVGQQDAGSVQQAAVTLKARFAGVEQQWQAQVVRTEGELDPATRMVNVVARIQNPFVNDGEQAPLSVGLFVDAEIFGRTFDNVSVLPRAALRGSSRVLVVDDNDQLEFRSVTVLREADDAVYVAGSLQRGERVCISPLQSTAEGTRVRVAESEPAAATGLES
ncbi:MAG: efflux RND transporter periplasmic adaptor subunit [Pseudomonadales bacterium]